MTAQQFIEEVKGSSFATEDFPQMYEGFQKYQKLAAQTLNAFSHVCEKNQIPYQLTWGSLLGAVRDQGQIPWDYDIDVFVPYKDKDRLVEALKKDLDEDYYFYCPETDPKCRHVIMRLAPKGYHSDVLHVDVFYLIGTPEDPEERIAYTRRVAELSKRRYQKLVDPYRASMGRFKGFVKLCLERLKALQYSLRSIEQEYHSLCKQYDFESATYCVSADSFAADYYFPTALMKQTMLHPTKQGTFHIPVEYDQVLQIMYKNYKQVLPLEMRMHELSEHYSVLKKYSKK